ncbi:hypothetical protein KPE97_14620 [Acinetobacter baumannii]|nr:hypothetical protein P673_0054 [Acinetobacter baumannii UH6507]MBU3082387.1 hypothetical protein [Acinetobacter baumannii]
MKYIVSLEHLTPMLRLPMPNYFYMIEGAIIQRLSSDEVDERMVEVFLRGRCKVKMTHRLEDYPQLIRFSCGNQ